MPHPLHRLTRRHFSQLALAGSAALPAGPSTPYQASAENPGKPCSATVGTSGNAGERFGPVIQGANV